MKKRILAIILAFILALPVSTMTTDYASAAELTTQSNSGQFSNFSWVLDDSGKLTISGSGSMPDFTSDTIPWFDVKDSITKVVIESGATSIGSCAFYNCTNITSIYIPDTVARINNTPFYSCRKIMSMYIPASVTYVAGSSSSSAAFFGTNGKMKLYLGCSKRETNSWGSTWNDYAIDWALTDISYNVDRVSYEYYTNDTKDSDSSDASQTDSDSTLVNGVLTIPEGIKAIPMSYYQGNNNIEKVILPEGMTTICESAFANCENLKSIYIPSTVTTIDSSAFYGCSSLEEVEIDDISSYLSISMGTVSSNPFYVNNLNHCLILNGKKVTKLTVPGNITTIPSYAFKNMTDLTSVTLEKGISYIKNDAFEGCSNLTYVYLPDSLARMDYAAFKNCTALRSLFLPVNLLVIKSTNSFGVEQEPPFIGCNSSLVLYAAVAEAEAGWTENFNYYTTDGATLKVEYDSTRQSLTDEEEADEDADAAGETDSGGNGDSDSSDSGDSDSGDNGDSDSDDSGDSDSGDNGDSDSDDSGDSDSGDNGDSDSDDSGDSDSGEGYNDQDETFVDDGRSDEEEIQDCSDGHSWGSWVVTKKSTCTKSGSKYRVCSLCQVKETKYIAASHSWRKWVVTKKPTCKAKGKKYHKCSVCGKKVYKKMAALGHSWGKWVVKKKPTALAKGLKKRKCSRCKVSVTASIAKLTPTIKLSANSVSIKKGHTYRLKVSNLAKADYVSSFSSSKKSVATVTSGGLIRAKKAGTATITVKLKSGKKAYCKVTVK